MKIVKVTHVQSGKSRILLAKQMPRSKRGILRTMKTTKIVERDNTTIEVVNLRSLSKEN
jgi:hypothetical protein